ncbi:pickpocket protein 28 isoform X1 [Microplitis mediator]|uniref:pickpocket protein 28 isoform X1 n=1 Tax=Microplitis mediator TaxID=375433 RepID=UPI0025559215|nr:pickpocket protein 28 isoform X1 [Microplitis mediator]
MSETKKTMDKNKSKKKKKNNKKTTKRSLSIWKVIKTFFVNSSLHGIRYLVEDDLHWSERLFWIVACGVSWWLCTSLILGIIDEFVTRKVAITMATDYLNWEISFPALHFCFSFSSRAKDYAIKVTGINPRKAHTLSRLSHWAKMGYDAALKAPLTSEELRELENQITPNCKDVFGVCIWNDKVVDCCKLFFPLTTNLGRCLSFNSFHSKLPDDPSLPKFVMNHHKKGARLIIYPNKTEFWSSSHPFFNLMFTNQFEYPNQKGGRDTFLTVQWSQPTPTMWDISQVPTYNDAGVKSLSIADRQCRLPTETHDSFLLETYNYHGCMVESQMKKFNDTCGCVGHIFPPTDIFRTCNYTELKCGFNNKEVIAQVENPNCLPDCEDIVIDHEHNTLDDENVPDWAVTKLEFNMLPGPVQRYERYTVHSMLDVIVSVGSALGLFVGASVLSIVEIPYWLFLRRDAD